MPLILHPLFGLSVEGEPLPGIQDYQIEEALDASMALMAAFEAIPAPDLSVEVSPTGPEPTPDLENNFTPPPPAPGRR